MKLRKLTKRKEKELQRLGRLYEQTHRLTISTREYLIHELGIPEDIVDDELSCFKIGDINSSEFITSINELIGDDNNG